MKVLSQFTIRAKLLAAAILSTLLILAVGMAGFSAMNQMQIRREKVERLEAADFSLMQREIDHLRWALEAGEFQSDESITDIDAEEDPSQCAFGKWYYGEGRSRLEKEIPEVVEALTHIEDPHALLHESVTTIEEHLSRGDEGRREALAYYHDHTAGRLADVQERLKKIRATIHAKVEEVEAEAVEAQGRSKVKQLILIAVFGIVGIAIMLIIARSITNPIRQVTDLLRDIAEGEGDLTRRLDDGGKDEMAQLSRWFNRFVENIRAIMGRISETTQVLAGSSEELSAVSGELLGGSGDLTNRATSVASTTEEMSTNINTMASAVEEMSVNAGSVAAAAEQMSQNMNAVSSAVEEMSVSINDIAKNAQEARGVSEQSNSMSVNATDTMGKLGDAAKEIGKVTHVIKRIAEQTNLLALNATIEAASAGEAGKGFAVVANEIKELANQSAQAAEDIASRIEGMQDNASDAVKVIDDVSGIIARIGDAVMVITQSVEQQTSASNEISANVVQASNGARNIASSIAEVAKGAGDVSKNSGEAAQRARDVASSIAGVSKTASDFNGGAQQINSSSEELARMAGDLKSIVGKFKI